ncbi:uncharacterized protein LOC134817073 [Bolinopsis microptera]|uniref:uncharacterized protein LOC134817073 n=1 Tax=Bolinopsis microptera TaxID=2820187 RepID=UPI00307948AC
MHTFCLTLEVFTALTPTCHFDEGSWWCPKKCSSLNICYPKYCNYTWDQPNLSIISEFDLTCHDAYKAKIVSSYAFLGYTFGCLFWGWVGDKIGRVPTIHLCQFLNTGLLFLTSLTPTYEWYCLARILTGFTACHWNTACVYATEWGGRKNRSFTLVAHIFYMSVAFALFGTLAYYIRPWRQLIVALSIFGAAAFLIMLPSLKESPRWLFCNGKKEQAVKNVQFAAKVNGLPIVTITDVEEDICLSESSSAGTESVWLLLQRPRLIFITLTFYLTSAANVLIYYMLKFSAEQLSSSPYLSCWLLSLSDIPSAVLIHFCSDLKRRPVNFWVQTVAVAFCFLCCVPQIRLASAVLCMAFAAVSFNYVYLYLAEVYPTSMRNRVTAGCIAVAEIGGMVANPLVLTTEILDILPFLIAASVAVGPTIASWWLPETKNRPLPDYFIDTLNIVYTPEERPLLIVPVVESPRNLTKGSFIAGLSVELGDSLDSRRNIPSLVDTESIELPE